MIRNLIACVPLFFSWAALHVAHDTLSGKSYDYFSLRLESDDLDSTAIRAYGNAFLAKAKRGKNWARMVDAYKNLLHHSSGQAKKIYADSMVYAASQTKDDAVIGAAFLTRGVVYNNAKQYARALDNYIISDNYISRTGDDYQKHKIKFNIAQIKYYLGYYEEAISLLADCVAYFKDEDSRAYLTSLHSLGLCYNRVGRFDKCNSVNILGISEAKQLAIPQALPHFTHSEGINQYSTGNYESAISKLTQALPGLARTGDFANQAVAWFYMGRSYWELQKPEKAIPFFLKIDTVFITKKYFRPEWREAYELLIDYSRHKHNVRGELYYINQLLRADKLLEADYKYLSGKIHKEYDTKKLLQAKAKIEESGRFTKAAAAAIIAFLVALMAFIIYRHKASRKRDRQRFEELMGQVATVGPAIKKKNSEDLDINPGVVTSVLKHLEKFEEKKKFLHPDMNLNKLAAMFGSNTKYVSQIIAHHKSRKSIDYINDLRIEYIVQLLKADRKYRNYTGKALADEAGFSTQQHFSRAFVARTGITPFYFVQQLLKENGFDQEAGYDVFS